MRSKLLAVMAAGLAAVSLRAADVDMVIAVNGAALNAHPQVMQLREKFDREAKSSGGKSFAEQLGALKLTEEMLENRLTAYISLDTREGAVVIDTKEGKAPELFEKLREILNFRDGGTKTEVAGCPVYTGVTADGSRGTILLKSPSQIQIQAGESLPLPLNFGRINKNLMLEAKSGRLVNIALVPTEEMLAAPDAMPQMKSLRMITLGLTDTKPEAAIVFEGLFKNDEAAMEVKGLVDVVLFGFEQNQALDNRFFRKIESNVAGGKLTYRRVVDDGLLEAILQTVGGRFGRLPEAAGPAAVPETQGE